MDLAQALRYHGAARTLVTLPLYSNISWVMLLCTLVPGGTLILQDGFDTGAALEAIQAEAVTHTAMVPLQYQRLLDDPRFAQTDVSSMQAMMSCGSPLHAGLKERVLDAFPCGVIELYGLTEGVITTLDPEDARERLDSVGRPLVGTDIEIVDDADRILGPDADGEIVARGRITMPGYHGRPDADEEATFIDPEGRAWLRTGDLGRRDADGFLRIVGRKKDMILSGGQNIYPADIETVLLTHEAVLDAAVIGVESPEWGERPLAVIERAADADEDPLVIMEWLNARIGRRQRVVGIEVVDELPRNPNGKILKRTLREWFAGDRTRSA
jgi:acyl-CoA synthetase (AMP-forming)/AMP-acid ligase II